MTGFDAVLVVSYGGPRGPEDVLPFMRNATRGRGIPDERLVEVSGHYQLFGGVSPINERNAELMAALGDALASRGVHVPIVIGNRNWTPFLHETLGELKASGARRVLCLFTSAYASYSGCRQYREDLARALETVGGGLELTKVGPYAETPGFVAANADALRAAVAEAAALAGVPTGDVTVLFVTHSIPSAMDAASGPRGVAGSAAGLGYADQHRRVAAEVVCLADAGAGDWELVFCSRSGAPHMPWLEPDVNDRLAELAASGAKAVVAAPIGFVNDHMEVVFDLDTQARATAADLGLPYVRAGTAGVHPRFVAELAEAIATGALTPGSVAGYPACSPGCCASGRPGAPGAPAAPAACGDPGL